MLAKVLSRYWWLTLLRGVISVLFGIVLITNPAVSLVTLTLLFGVFVLIDGIAGVVSALAGRRENEQWGVLLLSGLCGIVVGVLTFVAPGITALLLLFYIAIWAIATGLLAVVAAIRLRHEIKGEFWMALGGLISIAFGVLLIARPGQGAIAVVTLIGYYAILVGVVLIALAFRARGFARRVASAAQA